MTRRRGGEGGVALGCWLALGCTLAACSGKPVEECLALLEDGEERAAVEVCERAFAATADPRAGLAAARAQLAVGAVDEALAWAERLEPTSQGAAAFELAAQIHGERGEKELAVGEYERAADLYRTAGDDRRASRAAYSLFYLSWEQARYRDAFRWAWQAHGDASRAGDRTLQAMSLAALASTLFEVGDLAGTLRVVEAALETTPPEERTDRARLLLLQGVVELRTDRPALARDTFERALHTAAPTAEARFFRSCYFNQVDADIQLADWEAAERHLAAAHRHIEPGTATTAADFYSARLALARGRFAEAAAGLERALAEAADPAWKWMLLHLRGQAHEGSGDWRLAERDYLSATETLEAVRGDLGFDELKAWLQDERREPYESLFSLQAEHRGASSALDTVERAKARVFVEALVRSARERAPEERDLDGAWVEEASELAGLLPVLTASPAVEHRPLAALLPELREHYVLEYFVAEEEVWLLVVGEGEVRSRRLQASSSEVDRLATRFRSTPDDVELAAELGAILLPEDVVPRPGTRLELVTDGVLGEVPFAALRRRGRFVIEDLVVTYVPSLNALAGLSSSERRSGRSVLVVGNPLGDLPASAAEAREVAAHFGVEALLDQRAALAALEPASSVRLLHLATHTGLGPTGPWLSLADGVVDAGAVLSGRLGGEVVILASCASAAREGKGLWGSLGAAFLAAGSRAVVASLWSVDDRAAARVVRLFYANDGEDDPAKALAIAQRDLIAAGEPPSAWAAFVVFGADEPLSVDSTL